MLTRKPRWFSWLRRGAETALWSLENTGAAILVFMTALITVEVVGRTVFGFSTGLAYELIGALTGCLGFVGLASTFRKGAHVRILALVVRAPRRLQAGLDVIAHLLALAYALVLLVYASRLALHSLRVQERSWAAVPFPIYPFKILFFIGAVAFTAVIAWELFTLISGRRPSGADRFGSEL